LHSTNKSKGNIDKEIEEEIVTDNIKNDTVNKEEADKVTLVEFEESYKDLCENSCPYLFEMFGGENKLPTHILNVIFGDLISLLGKSDKSIDFVYGNGKCGHAIIVPQAKSQISFMEYARKFKWVESMLEYVVGQDCD
jgi:hypothetical protein